MTLITLLSQFMEAKYQLPPNMRWYKMEQQIVFDIRKEGVTTDQICYLISNQGKDWYKYGIIISKDPAFFDQVIVDGINEFAHQLVARTAKSADLDGGDLGLGDNK